MRDSIIGNLYIYRGYVYKIKDIIKIKVGKKWEYGLLYTRNDIDGPSYVRIEDDFFKKFRPLREDRSEKNFPPLSGFWFNIGEIDE